MNKSKYNNMFKVSPIKRKFLDTKTGILTENGFHEVCKYDVHDMATYDMNGNFIEYGEQTLYNTCFLILLSDLHILEVKDFFNYHYDYTPNKEAYLDYLEFGILNDKSIYLGIKELCKKLIDEKRKINEQLIYENQIAVKILGYGKQNISSKNQTVLNYIDNLLIENDLKPIDAIKILNKSTSNFRTEFKDAHYQNIINYLESLIRYNEPQQSTKEPEKIEFNTRIFTSLKGFMLFDKLVKKCPKVSDTYSFIYLQLVKDGYIFKDITHKEIKDFFNSEPYKITIDKIKTLNVLENEQRMALYSSVLDSNK